MLATILALSLTSGHINPTHRAALGHRIDKDGWIYLQVQGSPHEVGYEQGTLAASEIDDTIRACAAVLKSGSGKSWDFYRKATHQLFWKNLDPEIKDELQGIAEAVTKKGFVHDVDDLLALNAYIEIDEYYLPYLQAHGVTANMKFNDKLACSAFVATGSATPDGKPIIGHNFWWDYTMGSRWNMILDVTPSKGHRFLLDGPPGFIHSGSDFAINDAGMMLCETTISGFRGFDPAGIPEFVRMRKAIQYGDSLDSMVAIFKKGNNGGYANTWLMADTKTNEIGKLELGLLNTPYSHTSDGYYVGSNFAEDPKLTKEETNYVPTPDNNCEMRKAEWNKLLDGKKVTISMAEDFLANSLLCGGALNAKVANADSVAKMQLWARMGKPTGNPLTPPSYLTSNSQLAPFQRALKSQPWSLFPPNP